MNPNNYSTQTVSLRFPCKNVFLTSSCLFFQLNDRGKTIISQILVSQTIGLKVSSYLIPKIYANPFVTKRTLK